MAASTDVLTLDRRQSPARRHAEQAGPLHPVSRGASSRRSAVEDSRTDQTARLECPLPRGYAFGEEEVAVACVLWEVHQVGVRGGGWQRSLRGPD